MYGENIGYYLLGESDVNYRSSGAQSLVIWKAINFASKVLKAFDFESSNVEGIENYRELIGEKRYIARWIRKGIAFLDGCFEDYIVKRIDGVIIPCPMIKRR